MRPRGTLGSKAARLTETHTRIRPKTAIGAQPARPDSEAPAEKERQRAIVARADEPALDVSIPPPGSDAAADSAPVQIELVHNVSRPIYTIEQLNREQQHLDRTREKLLTK